MNRSAHAEVAGMLGLSSGSLTRVNKPLISMGVMSQSAPVNRDINRPAVLLRIVGDTASFLDIKSVPGAQRLLGPHRPCGMCGRARSAE